MRTPRHSLLLLAAVAACLCTLALPAAGQTPESCVTTGYLGYYFTTTNDGVNTTLHFTFCNRSPISGIYVNVGQIFFFGLPVPVGTPTSPAGWGFNHIGPKLFYATTSSPWWKTPPAIKPGDCLSGFDYTIPGLVVPSFQIVSHVQNVMDATGQTAGPLGTWHDCAVVITPPEDQPCISIIKAPNPAAGHTGDLINYMYTVCNCGDTSLTVTSVVDDLLGDLTADFIAANAGSDQLAVGQCVNFSVGRIILPTDPNPIPNCVTVEADPPVGDFVTDTECANVVHIQQNPGPCIELTKSVFPVEAMAGDHVIYSFKVCNCGDEDLTVTALDDNILGDLLPAFLAENGGSDVILVDQCVDFDVVFYVGNALPTPLINCATVDTEEGVTDTECATLDISEHNQDRRCFLPVTLTPEGWHDFCDPNNSIIPGGLIYNKLGKVFATFSFYGGLYKNRVIVGYPSKHTLAFEGTKLGTDRLCAFFPQTGPDQNFVLYLNYVNPLFLLNSMGEPKMNDLAGEALALMLNIGYNDKRMMPRTPGYDLEKFTLTRGIFRGKKVGQVIDIANKVLAGQPTRKFGLPGGMVGMLALINVIRSINSNYELHDLDEFHDRGYLLPNRPLGKPDPPHIPMVPFW